MQFALLGDHLDGLDMARALVETGRHELAVYSGAALGMDYLRRWGLDVPQVGDLEEVLADPAIEAVIVASSPALRPAQLRRALQAERHVLCLHPVEQKPDTAYEAALLRQDTGRALVPLLTEALHPAFRRFLELWHGDYVRESSPTAAELEQITAAGPAPSVSARPLPVVRRHRPAPVCQLGVAQILLVERCLTGPVGEEEVEGDAAAPGWDALRLLGGEVAEIVALAPQEELKADQPLLLAGRFLQGLMFQATILPQQIDAKWTVALLGSQGEIRLEFPGGWPSEARLMYRDLEGHEQVEEWPPYNPWATLVEVWEDAVAQAEKRRGVSANESLTGGGVLTWQDAIRALELDDAVRRSVSRRRGITLDFQELTEEATFKGTMTLVGCSLLWTSLMLLILSVWVPWMGWLILPVFGAFLVMQFLGWAVPRKEDSGKAEPAQPGRGQERP